MIEIDLNPDNEHHPERTAHTADVMSDCVRILNYATEKGGLRHASDGYRMIGELRESAWREAELLDRLANWAAVASRMGAWEVDNMGAPEEIGPRADRLIHALRSAGFKAQELSTALLDAHNAIGRIRNVEAAEQAAEG